MFKLVKKVKSIRKNNKKRDKIPSQLNEPVNEVKQVKEATNEVKKETIEKEGNENKNKIENENKIENKSENENKNENENNGSSTSSASTLQQSPNSDIPTTTPPIILTTPDISEEVIEGLAEVQEPSNKNDNNLLNTDDDGKTLNQTKQQSLDDDVANMTKFLKSIDAEGKETSRTVNRIYEEVAVFSQLITNLANLAGEMKEMKQNKQTIFSAPTISPRELYDTEESVSDIPTNRNDVVKKLLRKAIPVACKTLNIFDDSPNEPARIKTELSILNSIQSSNKIIKFHGQSEINGHPVLVFDWAEHGNLKGLYERGPLSWGEKLKIAHDIASGLVFLQACQVYHHDIRCENIL
ncbi:kinase-like protein, partial [Rhizophagus irregularis]